MDFYSEDDLKEWGIQVKDGMVTITKEYYEELLKKNSVQIEDAWYNCP